MRAGDARITAQKVQRRVGPRLEIKYLGNRSSTILAKINKII
jgi:hypothetical protein